MEPHNCGFSLSRLAENSAEKQLYTSIRIKTENKINRILNNKADCGRAAKVSQFLVVKSSSLFSDDILDSEGAKMLLCRISAFEVESVEAGVAVVVAVDRQEEGVERGADVGSVERWFDEITRVAGSGKRAAAVDSSFF